MTALLLLTSCSETEEGAGQRVTFEARTCIPSFVNVERGGSNTRSWTPPTGYTTYDDLNGEFEGRESMLNTSIEAFFTKNGMAPQQGTFFYHQGSSSWRLSMDIESSGDYFLYGFQPKDEASTSSIAPNGTFENGAVMTMNGLSTVTTSDICVVVGAKDGVSSDEVNDLTTGNYVVNAKTTGTNNHNYIFLLFDHIYSAIGLRFKVDAQYNSLRTIKLRKLEMKALANGDGVPIKAKQNAVVTLQATNNGTSPIVGNIVFTPDNSSADAEMEPIYEGEVTLSTDVPVNFMGSFIPGSTNYFQLRSTYDVYDKAGNLVSDHKVAENTIDLRSIFSMSNILRGHMYYITFKIQPTYLNVLSNPDLDSPILKEN